jgi:hypothetical protein
VKKLIVLAVILGLLAAADLWVKSYAEKRIANELQSSFDDAGEADVELSGFPITVRLLSGTIPSVRVTSSSLRRQDLRFTDVNLTMQDVKFSLSSLASGEMGAVTVEDGHGRVSLPASELAQVFATVIDGVEMVLDDSGLKVQVGPLHGTAQLALDGTELVLRSPKLGGSFRVDLPRFVDGLQYRSVRVTGAEAILEFSLKDSSFTDL